MLSIVMSVYNGERTVERAIESMLNQTYDNFEFIIIDDCSQDKTLKILKTYQDKDDRVRIITNEQNLGIATSLNNGIIEAKGDWIVRMDDDDESLPERLEKQVDFIQNNPDVDIFGGKVVFQDIIGNEVMGFSPNFPPIDKDEIIKLFYRTAPLIHPTVCMRKQSIINIGMYNKDFSGAEDYELWMRAWKNGLNIKNMDELLIRYTINPQKKSLKRIWKKYCVKNYIIKEYNFPLKYYFQNFAILIRDILIKLNLYNSIRYINNSRSS